MVDRRITRWEFKVGGPTKLSENEQATPFVGKPVTIVAAALVAYERSPPRSVPSDMYGWYWSSSTFESPMRFSASSRV